jgi:ribose/xylose/arabinose/galactoside ABC-type transport system permease subunit
MAGINPYYETIVIGTILLAAVFLMEFFKNRAAAVR